MSCCSKGYCQFNFPEGPPLTDNAVTTLSANYLFLPYGTLLEKGEVIRIWLENGQFKVVMLEEKWPVQVLPGALRLKHSEAFVPWQLVAMDSGMTYEEMMGWYGHPLHNPNTEAVVLKFKHPVEEKVTLKMRLLKWLYKIRTL